MSWQCPECRADAVHSRQEVSRVYNWRAIVRERGIKVVANRLRQYRRAPQPDEDASAFVGRVLREAGRDEPAYLCVACVRPWSRLEVPA